MYVYRCFGLNWRIGRPIRTLDLALVDPETHPVDVTITFGALPQFEPAAMLHDLELTRHDGGLLIFADEVGRFFVRNGREIVVDPVEGAGDAEIDLYLAGSVMGAVLHQRGILPIHCNAFEIGGKAVLVCGDSGAGKSTLACALEAGGHALLTDDVCAVTFGPDGRPVGHPGLPRLRLWPDARAALGFADDGGVPIPWTDGKMEMSMSGNRVSRPLEIAAIYHLREVNEGEVTRIVPLDVLEAVDVISSSIYRRRIGDVIGHTTDYLSSTVSLAKQVPTYAFIREWGFDKFGRDIESLLKHLHYGSLF